MPLTDTAAPTSSELINRIVGVYALRSRRGNGLLHHQVQQIQRSGETRCCHNGGQNEELATNNVGHCA